MFDVICLAYCYNDRLLISVVKLKIVPIRNACILTTGELPLYGHDEICFAEVFSKPECLQFIKILVSNNIVVSPMASWSEASFAS